MRDEMSKTEQLLLEIQRTGGMTYTQCLKFMVELKFGPGTYDWKKHRGYYAGTLCGVKCYDGRERPKNMGPGSVLEKWCDRDAHGKYTIKPGAILKPPYYPQKWPK
jgi:hypothetical protein